MCYILWAVYLFSLASLAVSAIKTGNLEQLVRGHPTTVFWEISVRSSLECQKFSRAQEQLKISKMFCGGCLLGSEFRVCVFSWVCVFCSPKNFGL